MNENKLGENGFYWFVGVIEDRHDPLYAGRLRVRVVGVHTQDKQELPTADLPWASVILPATSSGISGIGYSPTNMLQGSWVFGFFRDGHYKQEPVVVGSMPGISLEKADKTKGFYDPAGIYPKALESDVNRLAVNLKDDSGNEINPHLSLVLRRATRIQGIPTADFNSVVTADGTATAASDGTTWNQPEIPYATVYPFNDVYETSAGHILEFDNTLDNERIHLRHITGTSMEIGPAGTQTEIIKGDHNILTNGKTQHYIQGNSDTTISGRHKLYINKDGQSNNHYDIQIGPNANVNIQVDNGDINLVTTTGKINMNAGGDYNLKVGGNYTVSVDGNILESVEGNKTSNTTGAVVHRGNTIDLNP